MKTTTITITLKHDKKLDLETLKDFIYEALASEESIDSYEMRSK